MKNIKSFQKDGSVIYWGDAVETLKYKIPDNSVNLIFADPPYNIGKKFGQFVDRWPSDEKYAEWCYDWLSLCINKLTSNGSMYIMSSTQCMPYLDLFLRSRVHVLSRIAWYYDSSGVQAKKYYGSLYEPILFCVKDKDDYTFNANAIMVEAKTGAKRKLIDYRKPIPTVYNSKKVPGNVWEFPRVRYRMDEYENHPTQKPIALLKRIILASSKPEDVVLDPFSGTFTTSCVANDLGRRSLGIEIEEEYIKIGLRRLQISDSFNGVQLKKEARSFERASEQQAEFGLFEGVTDDA